MISGMKGSDILRIVDALHREKGVDIHYFNPTFCSPYPFLVFFPRTRVSGIPFFNTPIIVIHDFISTHAGNTKSRDGEDDSLWGKFKLETFNDVKPG